MYLDTDRDIATELRTIIDKEISEAGPVWTSAEIAARVVAKLRVYDQELLTKWLDAHAVPIMRETITGIARANRTKVRFNTIKLVSTTRSKSQSPWLDTEHVVNENNQRKRLGDMERDDLLFAATMHTKRAKYSSMQSTFLRVLADRVGSLMVRQVLDDDQLARLWRSLS